jgi:hypothetical protein
MHEKQRTVCSMHVAPNLTLFLSVKQSIKLKISQCGRCASGFECPQFLNF